MIKVSISNKNFLEKEYICKTLLYEYLGQKIEILKDDIIDYKIQLENGGELIIEDHFFSNFENDNQYLNKNNLPETIEFCTNEYIVEDNLPIIFGKSNIQTSKKKIICSIDIFSSSYFMLSRWEEYIDESKDLHNRSLGINSIAYKNNFLDRPVVNEYAEMLYLMLKKLDRTIQRKTNKYQFLLTHDVDILKKWKNNIAFTKSLLGDLFKRKDLLKAKKNILEYSNIKLGIKNDEMNSFSYLMDLSEKHGIKSHFFFMSGGKTKYENFYNIKSEEVGILIKNIINRGHKIGFHPSYNTYNNEQLWKEELDLLENVSLESIKYGRQHYLNFSIPDTWQIWDNNHMNWDNSLGYPDKAGFRCGTCYKFKPFNIVSRKTLELFEIPLLCMDVTFTKYYNYDPPQMLKKVHEIIIKTKNYDGIFSLLWHNSSLYPTEWIPYSKVYNQILRIASSK